MLAGTKKTTNQSTTRSARGCHPCLRYDLLPMSPVRTDDCVVELVGLEPTTKVLWNMVGVRPAHLVGHPCRLPGVLLFCLNSDPSRIFFALELGEKKQDIE